MKKINTRPNLHPTRLLDIKLLVAVCGGALSEVKTGKNNDGAIKPEL